MDRSNAHLKRFRLFLVCFVLFVCFFCITYGQVHMQLRSLSWLLAYGGTHTRTPFSRITAALIDSICRASNHSLSATELASMQSSVGSSPSV